MQILASITIVAAALFPKHTDNRLDLGLIILLTGRLENLYQVISTFILDAQYIISELIHII